MTKNTILQEAESHIHQLFERELTDDHRFHDIVHTQAVRNACKQLAQKLEIGAEDLETLELAALFHDVGYTLTYSGHEVESRRIAEAFLKEHQYPAAKLQAVLHYIDVTYPGAHPENITEQIIKDADYVHLASENYLGAIESLRHEWEVFLDKTYNDSEWYRLNYDFLKNHQYITPAARELFEPQKEANLKQLKKL
ncbi:MAG: HD domain-containing protein [Saprospiraceae bacterium]|nr:HD domain-containing protein [Saprospiraceae bacterium]